MGLIDMCGLISGRPQIMPFFNKNITPIKVEKLPGRNDKCSCGSNKKFKKCCKQK